MEFRLSPRADESLDTGPSDAQLRESGENGYGGPVRASRPADGALSTTIGRPRAEESERSGGGPALLQIGEALDRDKGAHPNSEREAQARPAPTDPTPFVDTIPGDATTTATLVVGGSVNSRLDTVGDRDWFRIELVAGQRYTFTLNASGADPLEDPFLRLYNSAGVFLAENDDIVLGQQLNSRLSFTATASGTFYLAAGSFNDLDDGDYTLAAVTAAPLTVYTNDQIATYLSSGFWGGIERHFNVAPGGTITVDISALTAAGQFLAREALNLWTDATGIIFSEIVGTAQIEFDDNQDGAFANSTRIGNIIQSSTVNVGTGWLSTYGTTLNTYSFQTYIHEIGHAIGLGHAGPYNGTGDYSTEAEYLNDSWATTVMSYFDQLDNTYFSGQGFTFQFAVTPIVADILATTSLYGTPSNTRTGNTTYGFNNNSGRAIYDAAQFPNVTYTIIDHGGTDTLDYSGFSQTQRIDLNAEAFSNVGGRTGNVTIARGSVIENVVGGSGNDTIIGNGVGNLINLSRGGADNASGGGGDDGFIFGAAYTNADVVDGGAGAQDQIGLQGNYAGGVTLGSLSGVEFIVLLAGDDNRFGGATGTSLSYNITTVDANVAAGQLFTFQANTLRAGENFTLNGSAETDGTFFVYGGLGTENLTGGAGVDGFYFGTGRWGASDRLDGGGGSDQFGLQGNYAGANAVTLGATQLTSIEFIVLLSATDTRFNNPGSSFSYTLTMNDGNVAAGQQMTVSANTLRAGEILTFDGSAETNGTFRLFSGAGDDLIIGGQLGDDLWANAGHDVIEGRGGADTLRGGLGNDRFVYRAVTDSLSGARDTIFDFATFDLIDLAPLAANVGWGAFTFIGDAAATGGGQLRVVQTGSAAVLEIFTNGDLVADLVINVNVADGHALTRSDFAGVAPANGEGIVPPMDFAEVELLMRPDAEPYHGASMDFAL